MGIPVVIAENGQGFPVNPVKDNASTASGCSILVEQQNTALLSLLGIDILTAGVTLVNGASVRITAIET